MSICVRWYKVISAADCIRNAGLLIVPCHCTNIKFVKDQKERMNHDSLQCSGRRSSHSAIANETCFVIEFRSSGIALLKFLDLLMTYCIEVRSCLETSWDKNLPEFSW